MVFSEKFQYVFVEKTVESDSIYRSKVSEKTANFEAFEEWQLEYGSATEKVWASL